MLIGIDVGGTHTRIAVAYPSQDSPAGPSRAVAIATTDWRRGQLFSDQANADRLISHIPDYKDQGQDAPLVAGVHGCDSDEQCGLLATWLAAAHSGPVMVVNDSELFGPAMGLPQAINVVAGTGSIVLGRDAGGHLVKVGGHGWLLGDPGSAPGLVREAVKAVAQAADAGQSPGALGLALMSHFGSADPISLVYDFTAAAEITTWGGLCPLVFEAAESGDQLALGVITQAAEDLARDICQLKTKGAVGQDVVLGGGVVRSQPRLGQQIADRLGALAPSLRVTTLRREPIDGALALAGRLTSLQPNVSPNSNREPATPQPPKEANA
ncbi:MAG: hypothetical protein FWD29_04770 [Micrococcales bacterium]|nr:hypothetical protein [Micrococcales bacterium]